MPSRSISAREYFFISPTPDSCLPGLSPAEVRSFPGSVPPGAQIIYRLQSSTYRHIALLLQQLQLASDLPLGEHKTNIHAFCRHNPSASRSCPR